MIGILVDVAFISSSCSSSDDDGIEEQIDYTSENFDFSAKNSDGVTIYYNYLNEDEAEVTYALKKWDDEYLQYRHLGYENVNKIKIPSTVSINGKTLKVTKIGEEAFDSYFTNERESITIPNSITSIGKHSLGLVKKIIVTDLAAWCQIKFDEYAGGSGTLYSDENTEITNLVIPSGVTSISDYAFGCCPNVTSISLPSTLVNIGKDVFSNCQITSITIPSSVEYIGDRAFETKYLVTVVSQNKEPIPNDKIGYKAFHDFTLKDGTLFVPVGSLSKYKEVYGWNKFKNIKEKAGI